MGQKRAASGLYLRKGIWHIDKQVHGRRICQSTGTTEKAEAEVFLAHVVERCRKHLLYGEPEQYTFEDAAVRYAKEGTKKSLDRDLQDLTMVMPYIGQLLLPQVHSGTLQPFIARRKQEGVKSATVNRTLTIVKLVLKRASGQYRDTNGHPWLLSVPEIPALDWHDKRKPYPISAQEEVCLMAVLSPDLQDIATFLIHTGLRARELCALEWAWERQDSPIVCFEISGEHTKNNQDKLVVCNRVARAIVESRRGNGSRFVFPSPKGGRRSDVKGTGWRSGRERAADLLESETGERSPAGFRRLRVHDLRHTFGQRLRRCGVVNETRKDLLGHCNGDVTTRYSAVEVAELYRGVESLCGPVLGGNILAFPAKLPQASTSEKAIVR